MKSRRAQVWSMVSERERERKLHFERFEGLLNIVLRHPVHLHKYGYFNEDFWQFSIKSPDLFIYL